ncbi:MAG: hypothetical protein PVI40_07910 [Chlamydiota bacterium]|jgi:hypothetical protein
MISIERYKRALQDFANMDLGTSRVAFSREELMLQGVHNWVTVPKIEQKTYKIIQVVQRIFYHIFGKLFSIDSGRLETVRNLDQLTADAISLFYGREDLLDDTQIGFDLKNEVTQVALQVLRKIKKACSSEQERGAIQLGQVGIRDRFSQARRQTAEEARGDEVLRLGIALNQRDSAIAEVNRLRRQVDRLRSVAAARAEVQVDLNSARAEIFQLRYQLSSLREERVEAS